MKNSRLIQRVLTALNSMMCKDDVIEELNIGMNQVSALVLFPELIASASVTLSPGADSVPLPANFQRNLFYCGNTDKTITVLNSRKQILAETNGMTGGSNGPSVVAIEGRNLIYYPAPVKETVFDIKYYRKPTEIKDDATETIIPVEFQKVLFHYALFSLYDEIEDGMEGQKVNTLHHEGKYNQYLSDLKSYYREGVSMPPVPIVKGEFY